MIALLQETTILVQEAASWGTWLRWAALLLLFIFSYVLYRTFYFRKLDESTRLQITYSVGELEHLPDITDIPQADQTNEPTLYVKVRNRSKMNVRINNVLIELKQGRLAF